MAKKTAPTTAMWKKLKEKYGVPDKAVKGVDVAKALDQYWTDMSGKRPPQMVPIAEECEQVLAKYISKFDKKKVRIPEYDKFEKEFLDDFVGAMHEMADDFRRYTADIGLYAAELRKFFNSVTKLDPEKTTLNDLEAFKSGPQRGLTALAKSVKGIDPTEIDKLLGKINDTIDKMSAKNKTDPIPQLLIDNFVAAIGAAAEKIAKIAKAQDII